VTTLRSPLRTSSIWSSTRTTTARIRWAIFRDPVFTASARPSASRTSTTTPFDHHLYSPALDKPVLYTRSSSVKSTISPLNISTISSICRACQSHQTSQNLPGPTDLYPVSSLDEQPAYGTSTTPVYGTSTTPGRLITSSGLKQGESYHSPHFLEPCF
jgi:hypothetical protein